MCTSEKTMKFNHASTNLSTQRGKYERKRLCSTVTEQVERLLEVIGDKEYSTKELMELLWLKHRPTFRDNYLLPSLELGLIGMTVPDKPNSSKQKYRRVQ